MMKASMKNIRFHPSLVYLDAEQIYKQAVMRYEQIKAQYEDARTRCEEAALVYEFMRVRQMEHEKERVLYKEMLSRLRREA